MLEVKKLGIILKPTRYSFESLGVFNPGVWQEGKRVELFYRAIDQRHRSTIGYARLQGPAKIQERWTKPIIFPEFAYEKMGVEDPRIVKIGNTFYICYVAHDGKNALTAYATSSDLKTFEKKGILSPRITYHNAEDILDDLHLKDAYSFFASYYEEAVAEDVLLWHKDVLLFPKKFHGKFTALHRVLPDIQIVFFDNFEQLKNKAFWKQYLQNLPQYVVLENKHWFETRNIGGGCPPIKTKAGWLLIFHAVEARNEGKVYHACAALLDARNPLKVIGRLHEPLFSPTEKWEREGFVPNVVFPTGTALFGDSLYIYYGAADQTIAVAAVSLRALLKEMKKPSRHYIYGKTKKER